MIGETSILKLTRALAKGSLCSWSKNLSRLKKVSKKMLAILQFLRSARVILPETFGLTRSSIWKIMKINIEHIHLHTQTQLLTTDMKSGFKKVLEKWLLPSKFFILLDSWDGKLLAFHDFPYRRKPTVSRNSFTSLTNHWWWTFHT